MKLNKKKYRVYKSFISFKEKLVLTVKINKSIEIVVSPKFCNINFDARIGIILDENKIFKILSKYYKNVLITDIKNEDDLKKIVERKPDLIFSGIKYFEFNNKKVWLSQYLDKYNIPYISSKKFAYFNERDKSRAKKIIQKANIETANFFTALPGEYETRNSIPMNFPLFIKPLSGGDSMGVDEKSLVKNFKCFTAKVLDIKLKFNTASIVETYLSGKEYTVGIFQDHNDGKLTAMPIEITVNKNLKGFSVLDFSVKRNNEEQVTSVTDIKVFNSICSLAKASFNALEARSFGRIDIKMNKAGVPHFMEANLMPGLQKGYFYRACLLNFGMDYNDMILNIAKTSIH